MDKRKVVREESSRKLVLEMKLSEWSIFLAKGIQGEWGSFATVNMDGKS